MSAHDYSLHAKLVELRSLIRTHNDVAYVLGFLGTHNDMFDSVSINSLDLDGKVHVYPRKVKGVRTSTIGFIKSKCYVYIRKDVRSGCVSVTPLTKSDVILQHSSGYNDVTYEEWIDHAAFSDTFLHPNSQSKVANMVSNLDIHNLKVVSEDVSSVVFGEKKDVYLTDDGLKIEMIAKVSAYLYFRKATVSDFIPGKRHTVIIHSSIEDVLAVWRFDQHTRQEYIGFKKQLGDGTYDNYNDLTSDNTFILGELGIPICLITIHN